MTTTTKDLSSALPGDIIRYRDGNPAHDGIGTVVGKDGMFLHVQFADRAEISLIGLTDAPWIDHLTLLPAPRRRVNYQIIESEKEALKAVEQDGYASQRPLFLYAGV